MVGWMNGWMGQWINEWMNEWMNDEINSAVLHSKHNVQRRSVSIMLTTTLLALPTASPWAVNRRPEITRSMPTVIHRLPQTSPEYETINREGLNPTIPTAGILLWRSLKRFLFRGKTSQHWLQLHLWSNDDETAPNWERNETNHNSIRWLST
jgi:hypothetical protein